MFLDFSLSGLLARKSQLWGWLFICLGFWCFSFSSFFRSKSETWGGKKSGNLPLYLFRSCTSWQLCLFPCLLQSCCIFYIKFPWTSVIISRKNRKMYVHSIFQKAEIYLRHFKWLPKHFNQCLNTVFLITISLKICNFLQSKIGEIISNWYNHLVLLLYQ